MNIQGILLLVEGGAMVIGGICYLRFRARGTIIHEVMLGTAMTMAGLVVAAIGGILAFRS